LRENFEPRAIAQRAIILAQIFQHSNLGLGSHRLEIGGWRLEIRDWRLEHSNIQLLTSNFQLTIHKWVFIYYPIAKSCQDSLRALGAFALCLEDSIIE
jgi:hypothetical protein